MRQLKTQIEDLERFVHFLQISGSAAGALLLITYLLFDSYFVRLVLYAFLGSRCSADSRMTRISCAGNASSTEGGAAGQNSAALNGAGVSPSRSPGRSGARRKPRLSQPTSAGSRSSRVRYPGAVVEAESGESISRERTRRSHGRCATPHLLRSHVLLHLHIMMYEYSVQLTVCLTNEFVLVNKYALRSLVAQIRDRYELFEYVLVYCSSPKTSESDAALGCGCLGAPTADEATRAGRHRHGSQSQEREPATTNADPKQARRSDLLDLAQLYFYSTTCTLLTTC